MAGKDGSMDSSLPIPEESLQNKKGHASGSE